LVDNLLRKGTPNRVHHMELFQDVEIAQAIGDRFGLADDLDRSDPAFEQRKYIAVQRFCGFDYVRAGMLGLDFELHTAATADTADLARDGGRTFQDEHTGPIMSWDDFENYPWPDPNAPEATSRLEWFQENLPDDMCIIGSGGLGHFDEYITWLMGYETLCYALFDQRDLVGAIADKLQEIYRVCMQRILQFDRVKIVWASDDMGFKTGLMISPDDTRQFVLTGHKELAAMSHAAGRPYLLHACGKLTDIIDDLIDDVKIDAKHSFEDTIEDVCKVKRTYGQRIALIGGIDVDFLCRSDEAAIRQRTRDTLDACMGGGGYCLGTGNSVANYIPLDNYLAMVDEGWLYGV
jgi:uroporphyrinogen decarboxylase